MTFWEILMIFSNVHWITCLIADFILKSRNTSKFENFCKFWRIHGKLPPQRPPPHATARPPHAHRTPPHAHRTPTARPRHDFRTSRFLWLLSTFFKIFMEIDCFCKFLVISRESREFEWFLANSAIFDGCQRFSGFCRNFIEFHVFCRFQMIISDFHEKECFLGNFTVSNGFEQLSHKFWISIIL